MAKNYFKISLPVTDGNNVKVAYKLLSNMALAKQESETALFKKWEGQLNMIKKNMSKNELKSLKDITQGTSKMAYERLKSEVLDVLTELNESFKSEYIGNDAIVWKKTKERNGIANFVPYYKGHDIDPGGYSFKSESELKNFIDDYIISNQEYRKYRSESTATADADGFETPGAFSGGSSKEKSKKKKISTMFGMNLVGKVDESKSKRPVNRWLELKNDESMHPHKKLSVGLKELKYQLREVERFLGWYNKIKNINELDSDSYWKRTNTHIYKIKERIVNIAKTLKEIEK